MGIIPVDKVTSSEAAAIIGVDLTRIQQLCRDGTLPHEMVAIGKRHIYLIDRAAVEAYRDRPTPSRGWPRATKHLSRKARKGTGAADGAAPVSEREGAD